MAGRPRGTGALASTVLVGLLAGCGLITPPGESTVARDVVEMKYDIKSLLDAQGQSKRTIDYRLETLEELVQTRNELLNSSLGEIDRRIREQSDEIVSLKKEMAELIFQIDALIKRLDMKPAQTSAATARMLSSDDAGETLYTEAVKAYNLGQYEEARQGFEQAIESGLIGDRAIQAQWYLSESLYSLEDYQSAYENYTRLITSNPSHSLAWQSLERLAEINREQGQPAQALDLYRQILARHPQYDSIERVKEKIEELKAQGVGTNQSDAPAEGPPAG